jgi:hypothetical protein
MSYPKLPFFGILLTLICAVSAAAENPGVGAVPMSMRGMMPVVEVRLNGQGPFAFMIDTGAGMQADIDPSVAEKLGLQITGTAINGDPSGENDRQVEITTIDSIELGGVDFRKVTAVVRPQRITRDYPDVDGILGFALFTDYLLTLDYPAMQVRLARGTLPAANGGDVLNFELENRIPVIEIALGKIRVRAHIDSGNFVAGFILPAEIAEQLQLRSQPVVIGGARSITNRIELKQAQLRDAIHIGRFDFSQPTIMFPSLSDANVGFKVLREFALTFDQINRRVKFERTS